MCYRACSNEQFMRQHMKNKMTSGHPQDAWRPIWLKACCDNKSFKYTVYAFVQTEVRNLSYFSKQISFKSNVKNY